MYSKSKIAALVAEFFGTAVLSLAIISSVHSLNAPIFVAVTAGLTVGLMILVVGSASGAHLNPAVTLGLWSMRKIETSQTIVYIASQLLGGLVALNISEYLFSEQSIRVAEWGLDKRVLVAEVLGTFIFTFGVAAAVYNAYEGRKLATIIGGSLAVGVLVASIASHGILNPAVVISLNAISWAYMLGPLMGSVLGMWTYSLLFAPSSAKYKITKKKTTRK